MTFNLQAAIDAAFADAEAQITSLMGQVSTLQSQVSTLETQLATSATTIADLQAQLDACQNEPAPEEPAPEEPAPEDPPAGTFWNGLTTSWPNASNTGPRVARTAASTNRPSGTVTAKRFTGTVIPSNNTVFIDCEFVGSGGGWGIDADGKRVTLDYCLMRNTSGGPAAILGNPIVTNCNISGWEDAIKTQGDGWMIKHNYIHGPHVTSTSHNDGIQVQWSNSNGLIEQNYIDWADTSAVFLQELSGQISNITIRHNWLGGADLPLRIEAGCTNCDAYENVIQRGHWGYADTAGASDVHGNIDSVTGAALNI